MNRFVIGCIAFVALSLWLITLPLTILGCLLMSPLAIIFAAVSTTLSLYKQIRWYDSLYEGHCWHSIVSSITFQSWFSDFTVSGSVSRTPTLYSVYPHGKFCFGPMLGIHFVRQSHTKFAVAPILFYIPIFGLILYYLHCIPASRHHIQLALERGWSVILSTEGVPGLICSEKERTVYFKKRWGAYRIARDTQTPMRVVFTHGELDTYETQAWPLWPVRLFVSSMDILCTVPFLWGERVFGIPTYLPRSSARIQVDILPELEVKSVRKTKKRVQQFLEAYDVRLI